MEIPSKQHEQWPSYLVNDLITRYPTLVGCGRTNVHYTESRWIEPDESIELDGIEEIPILGKNRSLIALEICHQY